MVEHSASHSLRPTGGKDLSFLADLFSGGSAGWGVRTLSSKHLSCTLSVAFVQPTGSRRPLLGPVLLSQSQSSEEHAPAGGRRASVVGPRARGCRPSSAPSGDHGGGTAHTGFHPPYWRRHASRSKAQAGGLGRAQQRAPLVDFDAQTADGCPTPAAERQRCR